MPTFSGKYEKWISFRNMFQSMIHQNASLPPVQKMQYLILALKGEAYDIFSSLEASADNYHEAWEMLKERYDDWSRIDRSKTRQSIVRVTGHHKGESRFAKIIR